MGQIIGQVVLVDEFGITPNFGRHVVQPVVAVACAAGAALKRARTQQENVLGILIVLGIVYQYTACEQKSVFV